MKKILLCGIAALAPALPMPAGASCGSAFCTANSSWDVQGAWQEPGWRLDLRYEYIDQDQPMAGSRKVGVGEIPQHHDEIRTVNRNLLTTLDYTVDADWGVTASLPVSQREHDHIHNHMGQQLPESWDFTAAGDARVVARRRLGTSEDPQAHSLGTWGANFGLKLPTGRTDVRNADGDLAERTLQPGSGTTDLVAGLYYSSAMPLRDLTWFVSSQVQTPLNSHQDFRPGTKLFADAGLRYAATQNLGVLVQLNAQARGRDAGAQAEPEDSGGKSLFFSPGLSYAATPSLQVSGFVQFPVYQYVNGVQLTAARAYALGASVRF
jgi:hypothetical protein